MKNSRNRRRLLLAGIGIGLSACSGGGGSAELAAVSPESFETAEYDASDGLAAIHASAAYAGGGTGQGVRIAIIDTGIDVDHPEFSGAIDPASTDIISGNPGLVDDQNGHGTAVAGVIGARRNGALGQGVAFESTLLAVRAETGSCVPTCSFAQSDLATATDYAVAHGSRVINYSLAGAIGLASAFEGALTNAAAKGTVLVFAAGNDGDPDPSYPARFAVSAAAGGNAIAVGAIDGNNKIVSFENQGWDSNRAGAARDFFLVAPGVDVATTALGGGMAMASGTSFAAPHVSGAAAVLLDAAPYLSAQQVVELLLTTATDLGAPGVDSIYGRGLVNLEEALRPQGASVVPLGGTVAESGAALTATGLELGAAFGDALASESLLAEAIFLDGYARPYRVDLAPAIAARDAGLDLEAWLSPAGEVRTVRKALAPRISTSFSYELPPDDDIAATDHASIQRFAFAVAPTPSTDLIAGHGYGLSARFGLAAGRQDIPGFLSRDALASSYLALAGEGDSLVLGERGFGGFSIRFGLSSDSMTVGASDREIERAAYVGELRHDWADGSHLALQIGNLVERGSALDTVGDGAFLLGDRSDTLFVGVSGSLSLTDRTELFGAYSFGRTRLRDDADGLLHDFSTVRSDSFGLGIATRGVLCRRDRLALSLSRPLKVTSGSAVLDIPVGRRFDGTIERRSERVDLVPSGEQMDAELSYRIHIGRGHDLRLNGMIQFEPGHRNDADPEMIAAAKYRLAF